MHSPEDISLVVNYDPDADVLYVALGAPVPAETDMDDHGFFLRFALEDGEPCGVTVMGFRRDHWSGNHADVLDAVSSHLGVPVPAVEQALHGMSI